MLDPVGEAYETVDSEVQRPVLASQTSLAHSESAVQPRHTWIIGAQTGELAGQSEDSTHSTQVRSGAQCAVGEVHSLSVAHSGIGPSGGTVHVCSTQTSPGVHGRSLSDAPIVAQSATEEQQTVGFARVQPKWASARAARQRIMG